MENHLEKNMEHKWKLVLDTGSYVRFGEDDARMLCPQPPPRLGPF